METTLNENINNRSIKETVGIEAILNIHIEEFLKNQDSMTKQNWKKYDLMMNVYQTKLNEIPNYNHGHMPTIYKDWNNRIQDGIQGYKTKYNEDLK